MTLKRRLLLLIILDSFLIVFAIFFSNLLVSPTSTTSLQIVMISTAIFLFIHHFFANRYKIYHKAWQYASIRELLAIFKAVTFTVIVTAILQLAILEISYLRVMAVAWMLCILLIGGSRFSWRLYRDLHLKQRDDQTPALIIGAGAAGRMVARQLLHNQKAELIPMGFIDDDSLKQGLEVLGIPVLGTSDDIEKIVKVKEIEQIIIAIPSLNKKELNKIFQECSKTRAKTQILPKLEDLMLGKVSINEFRNVEVEDLLGREPIELDTEQIGKSITGKTILVTGAGGSIGSEVCRQVCKFAPKTLILLGHGENSIYAIELELKKQYTSIQLETEIADVQDREKILRIMKKYRPNVVYHAAAHKHVPLMERNPEEAVKNNIVGTKNVAEAANEANVETFVMISTDKAVNPTSVMGATKRIAEMIVQHMDIVSETKFVAVRFGNVLGSRGSVIPLFKKQIQEGGPVTVTHPEMLRYFMTIPEASRLVLQAGALAKGGEIFVLDMGEPVKIVELARNLIKLSGYSEAEIPIIFTGLRPGEKMFEELLSDNEIHAEQIYPKIYVGKTPPVNIGVTQHLIKRYDDMQADELRKELLDIANFRKRDLRVVGAMK